MDCEWSGISEWKQGIFQPAMLVYHHGHHCPLIIPLIRPNFPEGWHFWGGIYTLNENRFGYMKKTPKPNRSLQRLFCQVKGNFVWPLPNERRCQPDRWAGKNNSESGRPTKRLQLFGQFSRNTKRKLLDLSCWFLFQSVSWLKDKRWEFVPLPFCSHTTREFVPNQRWIWTPIGVDSCPESAKIRWILKSVFPKVWVLIQLREVSFEQMVFGISVYQIILYSWGIRHVLNRSFRFTRSIDFIFRRTPFLVPKETHQPDVTSASPGWHETFFWCFKFLSLQYPAMITT